MTRSMTRRPFATCLRAAATAVPLMAIVIAPTAAAGSADAARPCFNVEVQQRHVNESKVQQDCLHNFNRTVQAGQHNQAQTIQSGTLNSNRTRQYQYAPWPGRMRPAGPR